MGKKYLLHAIGSTDQQLSLQEQFWSYNKTASEPDD
jgi:hypothetical protein